MTTVYLYGCRTQGTGGFYWRLTRYEAHQSRDEDLRSMGAGCQCTSIKKVEVPRVKPQAITNYIDMHLPHLWDRDWVQHGSA